MVHNNSQVHIEREYLHLVEIPVLVSSELDRSKLVSYSSSFGEGIAQKQMSEPHQPDK
jgi:hypothetical protein